MANWFTVSVNTDVDIFIKDIINNLDKFSENELTLLYKELHNKMLNKSHLFVDNNKIFQVSSLDDEYKIKTLKELYKKYTLEDIENVLNTLEKRK